MKDKWRQAMISECICGSPDHIMRLGYDSYYPDDMWIDVQLNLSHPWYKRMWLAVKYILGISTSRYGHWDCGSFSPEEVWQVRQFMDRYNLYYQEWVKNEKEELTDGQVKRIEKEIEEWICVDP
jgi:hypothetical protein